MAQLHLIVALSLIAFFLVLVASCEAGYRIGRVASQQTDAAHRGTGTIEAAIFGLFGLLLAFSFGAGVSNLVIRRDLIVQEANAIGTAYLRLDLLAAKDQPEMRKLFREYLDARIRAFQRLPDLTAVAQEFSALSGVRQRIWSLAVYSTRADPSPSSAMLLLPSINAMFDVATSRRVSFYMHLPALILALLTCTAVVCALLAGYAISQRGRRSWLHVILYALVTAITIYTIYDLDHPRGGLIRMDAADAALTELRNSMR